MREVKYLNLDISKFQIVDNKAKFIEKKEIKNKFKIPMKLCIFWKDIDNTKYITNGFT